MSHYLKVLEKFKLKAKQCQRTMEDITLIPVTKYQEQNALKQVYEEGCRNFAESRLQESLAKIESLPIDCCWHFIGTLQRNKVAKVLDHFNLIHSIDSLELARKVSETSEIKGKEARILLQVNTSHEQTKHGLLAEEWERCLNELYHFEGLKIEGLMTMAPLTSDEGAIRHCFRSLYELRERWKERMKDPSSFKHLSMGMSNDYLIAIEEGATLLRVGSAIFN